MNTEHLLATLSNQPIIASVKNEEELELALQSDVAPSFVASWFIIPENTPPDKWRGMIDGSRGVCYTVIK